MSVSRETEALSKYASLLRKWNPAINLVAPSTLSDIETRHVRDCVQLVHLSNSAKGTWADLGSGGGLPGLVVAICRLDVHVHLVESDRRKGSFLRNAAREIGLSNVQVISDRIESAEPLAASNVSARALAPLPLLLSYVDRHLAVGGRAWLMKGRHWQSEVEEARKSWRFSFEAHPSVTDSEAAILEISDLHHA